MKSKNFLFDNLLPSWPDIEVHTLRIEIGLKDGLESTLFVRLNYSLALLHTDQISLELFISICFPNCFAHFAPIIQSEVSTDPHCSLANKERSDPFIRIVPPNSSVEPCTIKAHATTCPFAFRCRTNSSGLFLCLKIPS